MLDGWDDGLVDDSPPWVGLAALAVGTVAVTAGVLVVGAAATVAGWLWSKGRR